MFKADNLKSMLPFCPLPSHVSSAVIRMQGDTALIAAAGQCKFLVVYHLLNRTDVKAGFINNKVGNRVQFILRCCSL